MTDNLLSHLSNTLRSEASFEGLVRQLLVMLELVTDLESTYLTQVDTEARPLRALPKYPVCSQHENAQHP
jgi:hypothetical protein